MENSALSIAEPSDEPSPEIIDEFQVDESVLIGSLETILKGDEFPDDSSAACRDANKTALLSIDELARQINADALSALAEKFNGKLSGVRPLDEKDILFSEGS